MNSPLHISVIAPLYAAWGYMKRVLFEPFDFKKWLVLGFSCFLANLGSYFSQGGGNYSGSGSRSESHSSTQGVLSHIHSYFGEYTPLVLGLGIVVLVMLVIFFIALAVALLWVNCRGTFIFLDNVVQNRAEIAVPWKAFAKPAWQWFYFHLAVVGGVIALGIVVGLMGGILVASKTIVPGALSPAAWIGLISIGVGFLIALSVMMFYVKNITVSRMYLRRCGMMEALRDSWDLFCSYPVEWILFLLMYLVLSIGSLVLVIICCLFTCCIAMLPYINQVVMLPLYVFLRAYSLLFLAQFGPGWNVFPSPPHAPPLSSGPVNAS